MINIEKAIELVKNQTKPSIMVLDDLESIYKNLKKKNSRICIKCMELENMNLPFDCLQKPSYCLKNEKELEFIIHYEELKSTTTNNLYS